jgi:hypothetical protein
MCLHRLPELLAAEVAATGTDTETDLPLARAVTTVAGVCGRGPHTPATREHEGQPVTRLSP